MQPQRLTADQRKLVEDNYALAKFLARKAFDRNSSIDLEEVTSVAVQGLISAALRFDPEREGIYDDKAFAGYARQRINGAILDWQRDLDHVQRSYRAVHKSLQRAGYGQGVPLEDAARAAGVEVEKAKKVTRSVELSPLSWEEKFDGRSTQSFRDTDTGNGSSYDDLHSSNHDVESSAIEAMIKHSGMRAYQSLSPLQQTVIALHYRKEIEIQTISTMLGVSIAVVREAHTEAVLLIHTAMRQSVHEQH